MKSIIKIFPFGLIVLVFTIGIVSGEEPEKVADSPPMYTLHDKATGKMRSRMDIANGKPCDTGFGTELESIMNEMEKNKDASSEDTKKLELKFDQLMAKTSRLCSKDSWCDLGICKSRSDTDSNVAGAKEAADSGSGSVPALGARAIGRAAAETDNSTKAAGGVPYLNIFNVIAIVFSILYCI